MKRMPRDLGNDIREHIAEETRDNIARGMSPEEAHHAARRKFGNITHIQEQTREVWIRGWMDALLQDVRYSLRAMRKNPGFTVTAVATLVLATGANAVVFSIANALVLRPLNVPQPERLYTIDHGRSKALAFSYPDYVDVRDHNGAFENLAAYTGTQAGLDTGSGAARAFVDEVSGNYFDVFGIQPYLGRFFHARDEHGPDSAPYMVLNYAYWRSHFQGDRGVVGRTVMLNKHPFTITGVAPPGFHGPVLFFTQDVFVPVVEQEEVEGQNTLNSRTTSMLLMTAGRLKAGVTPEQATANLNATAAYLEKTYPGIHQGLRFGLARPALFGDFGGPATRAFLGVLMLLTLLILLAACANLGSLFAAKASERTREIAMRMALGAGRGRILRALFTEAIVISLLGGGCGVWASAVLVRGLSQWRPIPQFPVQLEIGLDARVYAVAALLALISGLLFGAAPVRQIWRTYPYPIGKAKSGRGTPRVTLRDLLLGVQIAICAVLITSAAVAVRGMLRSLDADFGFNPRQTMLLDTNLAMAGYRGDAAEAMQKRILDGMQQIPGVLSAALADRTPLNGTLRAVPVFRRDDTELKPAKAAAYVPAYSVSAEYFRAAGTALLWGRSFNGHDGRNAPRVAVVNAEFARRLFGSIEGAAGKQFRLQDGTLVEIVGVAQDGKYERLTEDRQPAMFLPLLQWPSSASTLLVRAQRDPGQVAAAMRMEMQKLDPGLPVLIQTWRGALGVSLFVPRMATIALGVLGIMAAMLSLTGIFGMAAYSVSRRMKELGIRMALGATRKDVLLAALGRPFRLLVWGGVAGLLMGCLASRVLAAVVYQASARDPWVLAGAVLAMAALGLAASWIPAQRALSAHPLALLREE